MPVTWLRCAVVLLTCLSLGATNFALAQGDGSEPASEESVQSTGDSAQGAITAHGVVESVTADMLAVIDSDKELLNSDPSAYFEKVNAVLERAVAFPYIAKVVMADHYKLAKPEQRDAFAAVFQQTMVETIAKGMANYADSEITVRPPESDLSGERKVEVLQDVKGSDGNHLVSYTMAKNKEGDWKLINVVLNGVNLGKSFRDQYIQAARQHNNDYDKVTETWGKTDG